MGGNCQRNHSHSLIPIWRAELKYLSLDPIYRVFCKLFQPNILPFPWLSQTSSSGMAQTSCNYDDIFISVPCFFLTACSCSVAQSCPTLYNPMDSGAHRAPLSMGFSRQEYWRGLPRLLQGLFPTLEWNPRLPHLAGAFFTTEPPGKPF